MKQKLVQVSLFSPRKSSRAGSSLKKRRNPTPLKTPEKSELLQILDTNLQESHVSVGMEQRFIQMNLESDLPEIPEINDTPN